MKGVILGCFLVIVTLLLVSHTMAEDRWNFNEDASEVNYIELRKRTDLERPKRLCGISSRRRRRCRLGVRVIVLFCYRQDESIKNWFIYTNFQRCESLLIDEIYFYLC